MRTLAEQQLLVKNILKLISYTTDAINAMERSFDHELINNFTACSWRSTNDCLHFQSRLDWLREKYVREDDKLTDMMETENV